MEATDPGMVQPVCRLHGVDVKGRHRMPLTLTDEEVRALARFLDGFLPELTTDIANIERVAERHELAETERILVALRQRMSTVS
jgi:hypothetical protein